MRFQGPLLSGRINLAEVVDAGIGLGSGAGFDEVGNRDGRQEANDGHDDHDLNQRKAALAVVFHCLHFCYFLSFKVWCEHCSQRVIMITFLFTGLLAATTLCVG